MLTVSPAPRGRSGFNPPDGFNPLSGLPFFHPPGGERERGFTPKKHGINKGTDSYWTLTPYQGLCGRVILSATLRGSPHWANEETETQRG